MTAFNVWALETTVVGFLLRRCDRVTSLVRIKFAIVANSVDGVNKMLIGKSVYKVTGTAACDG